MKKIILILFLVSVFLLTFLPVKDTDFGWHYRCGNQFLKTGKLCLKNEFSYFLPNYQAYNPSFLYDIILAFVYNHFGFLGVSFLGSIILTLSAFFIFKLLSGPYWFRIIAFYLIFLLSYSTFSLGLRSQIVSFLFFVVTLFLINETKNKWVGGAPGKDSVKAQWDYHEDKSKQTWSFPAAKHDKTDSKEYQTSIDGRERRDRTHLFFLPLIFLIWVNAHIGFFLGPLILTIFLLEEMMLICLLCRTLVRPWRRATLFKIFFLTIFGVGATFLNPFGPKVYLEILRHAQAPLDTMIAEWVAPPFWQKILILTLSTLTLILELISSGATTKVNKDNKNNGNSKLCRTLPRPWQSATKILNIFLLLFFTILSLKARRNLPYFYTTLFYSLLNLYSQNGCRSLKRPFKSDTNVKFLTLSLLISLIFVLSAINLPQTINFHQSWENYCSKGLITYPCQAIEKTNLKKLSGNLYTAYEWGGFLIWQAPKLKVFVDGRMSAWKAEKEPQPGSGHYPYQVYLYIIQARPGWDKILKKYQTDYLLIGNGTFLDLELQKNGEKYGLKEVYRDQTAVFYTSVLSE